MLASGRPTIKPVDGRVCRIQGPPGLRGDRIPGGRKIAMAGVRPPVTVTALTEAGGLWPDSVRLQICAWLRRPAPARGFFVRGAAADP